MFFSDLPSTSFFYASSYLFNLLCNRCVYSASKHDVPGVWLESSTGRGGDDVSNELLLEVGEEPPVVLGYDGASESKMCTFSRLIDNRPPGPYRSPSSRASFSSWACCLLRATWAAITLCLSAISVHLAQTQSLQRQYLLCPLRAETTPWFRQRAHLGVLGYLSDARIKSGAWGWDELPVAPSGWLLSSSADELMVYGSRFYLSKTFLSLQVTDCI